MKQVLVFGPVSWDTVIRINKFPKNGGFVQGLMREERAGGAGLNIAAAVSSASINTLLFSYIGTDEIGKNLRKHVEVFEFSKENIREIPGSSLHALITIDECGERTIFALEKNCFADINFDINFSQNHIVVFPVWRDFYLTYLEMANAVGAMTVVGIGAITNPTATASIMIGSEKDVSEFNSDLNRFETTVITRGAAGVKLVTAKGAKEFSAKSVKVVDATGAGDSFLSGILVGLAGGAALNSAIGTGINWATAAITEVGSIPPRWREEFNLE
jgi:sugar/nucleoside kinase (ribokinase family)